MAHQLKHVSLDTPVLADCVFATINAKEILAESLK
jgi:hypothetical protein